MDKRGLLGAERNPYAGGCSFRKLQRAIRDAERIREWVQCRYPHFRMLLAGAEQARKQRKKPPFRPGDRIIVAKPCLPVTNVNLTRRSHKNDIMLDQESGPRIIDQIYFIPRLNENLGPWYVSLGGLGRELFFPARKFKRG